MNSGRRVGADAVHPSPATWRTSSHSSANCVEVSTDHPDLVHVRDSKSHGTGPTIAVTRRQWALLLSDVTQI